VSAIDPAHDGVYAELGRLIAHCWEESLDLVATHGVLPRRSNDPEYEIASARDIGLRYMADRADQRQFQATRSDELSGRSSLLRRSFRQAAWFLGGVTRGAHIGRLLPEIDSVFAVSTNVISINGDSRHFYQPLDPAGSRLADTAPVRVREALLHEIAHANFAHAAPHLARIPHLERSPALRVVLEGYPTWVIARIAARKDPRTGQLVDPELNAWQWMVHPLERTGVTPFGSPYRQGAVWFEKIHDLFGDEGVLAVARLAEAELPRPRWQWGADVGNWGDRTLGVPRRKLKRIRGESH
jgi:hypothetical protein